MSSFKGIVEKVLEEQNISIKYRVIGNGQTALLSFHGYGLDGRSWSWLDKDLSARFKLIHIDLPHHGGSKGDAHEGTYFKSILNLLHNEGIEGEIILLGFSLGANFCHHLMENIPERISRVILLAPDGYKPYDLKRFLESTQVGQFMRDQFIRNVFLVKVALKLWQSLGMLPQRVSEYYLDSISTVEKRKELVNRWRSVVDLKLNKQKREQCALENRVEIHIIAGATDRVIKAKEFKSLNKQLYKVKFEDIGHNMMTKRMMHPLSDLLK